MFERKNGLKIIRSLIILNPVLDVLSYISGYSGSIVSVSLVLRLILIGVLTLFTFIYKKENCIHFIIFGSVSILYSTIHILLYINSKSGWAYGTWLHELQYLFNYLYLITLLFIFYLFKIKFEDIKKALMYSWMFYLIVIVLSIITQTYSYTYAEGIGIKAWFNTGGQIGSTLIIFLFIFASSVFSKSKIKQDKFRFCVIILSTLTIVYLTLLLGTRSGVFGVLIYFATALFVWLLKLYTKFIKSTLSKLLIVLLSIVLAVGGFIVIQSFNSRRTAYLKSITDQNVHLAYDVQNYVNEIHQGTISVNHISLKEQNALIYLETWANKNQLANTDLRKQQMVFHTSLFLNQNNLSFYLFGNGFLKVMSQLVLEMEGLAIVYNFGLVGFMLFLMPFISILGYSIAIMIRYKRMTLKTIFLLSGAITVFMISFLSGHTFFNTSVALMIVVLFSFLLQNKEEGGAY